MSLGDANIKSLLLCLCELLFATWPSTSCCNEQLFTRGRAQLFKGLFVGKGWLSLTVLTKLAGQRSTIGRAPDS